MGYRLGCQQLTNLPEHPTSNSGHDPFIPKVQIASDRFSRLSGLFGEEPLNTLKLAASPFQHQSSDPSFAEALKVGSPLVLDFSIQFWFWFGPTLGLWTGLGLQDYSKLGR